MTTGYRAKMLQSTRPIRRSASEIADTTTRLDWIAYLITEIPPGPLTDAQADRARAIAREMERRAEDALSEA